MKLWHVESSVLGDNSISRQLTAGIVAREKALHPRLEVTYLDLATAPVQHLSPAHIGALFGHQPEDAAVLADIAIGASFLDTLFAANIIVIGAPMYNFGIPSQLKAWIDRIVVTGKTFKYGENGIPVGLVPAGKKVIIASSRGGLYTPGNPGAAIEHQESHLIAALNFIGLTDVSVVRAEGVAVPDIKPRAMASAEAAIAALA
ncbi:MAG TPA: NAD(P)H-dependent oxidoreductase [Acidocella sp.]|nr:NAD(P)H-dependent oxidoreductase [Acidocella sp.]